ncbi:hypothetical protein APR41_18075, partial [Salegentibacter salinarum]
MGKITPRYLLIILIYGLFIHSANSLFANTTYRPEKPVIIDKTSNEFFFIGFYLNAAPSITAPDDKTVDSNPGQCYALNVNLGSPQTSGGGNVTNDAPNQFPLGNTTVTWTITNEEGTATDSQLVTITDNEKPSISSNGNREVNQDPGECGAIVSVEASANDNCSVNNPTGTR